MNTIQLRHQPMAFNPKMPHSSTSAAGTAPTVTRVRSTLRLIVSASVAQAARFIASSALNLSGDSPVYAQLQIALARDRNGAVTHQVEQAVLSLPSLELNLRAVGSLLQLPRRISNGVSPLRSAIFASTRACTVLLFGTPAFGTPAFRPPAFLCPLPNAAIAHYSVHYFGGCLRPQS